MRHIHIIPNPADRNRSPGPQSPGARAGVQINMFASEAGARALAAVPVPMSQTHRDPGATPKNRSPAGGTVLDAGHLVLDPQALYIRREGR